MSGGCEFQDCSDSALFTCLCKSTLLCSTHLVKHVQAAPEQSHCPVPGLYKTCTSLEDYNLTKRVEKHQLPALENSLHERERLNTTKAAFEQALELARGKIKSMFKDYITAVKDRFLHCSAVVELEICAKREVIRKHVAEFGWKDEDQLFICKSEQGIDRVKTAIAKAVKCKVSQPLKESAYREYVLSHRGDMSDQIADSFDQLDRGETLDSLSLEVTNAEWFGHVAELFRHISTLRRIALSKCEDIGAGVDVLTQYLPTFSGTLVELSLEGLGLTADNFGQLAESVSALGQLQRLSLKGNRLRDEGMSSLSSVLSTLNDLQLLNLSSNIISYVGIQALAEALPKGLTSLDLSFNVIGNQGLEYLAQSFGKVIGMENLNLAGCGLKANLEEYWTSFGLLLNLRILDLSDNQIPFSRLLPVFEALARLTNLKLSNTDLSSVDIKSFSSAFKAFSLLQDLDLSKTVIGNEGSSAMALNLAHLKSLQRLNITSCNFEKEGVIRLATAVHHLEALEDLQMSKTLIGREGALHFSCGLRHLNRLKVLNLADAGLNEDGGAAIMKVLKHLRYLEELVLRDNHLMGDEPAHELAKSLPYLTLLKVLDLWNCGFMPEGIAAVGNGLMQLANIHTLVLGQNEVGFSGMKALNFPLSHLNTLQILNMVGCMLGSQGALHLSLSLLHLTQLKELYLTSNNFGNEGVLHLSNSLCFLTSLTRLSISENHFGRDALFKLCRAMTPMVKLREFCLFSNEFGVHQPRSVLTSIASRISMSYVELQDYNVDDLQRELQAALPMVETIT